VASPCALVPLAVPAVSALGYVALGFYEGAPESRTPGAMRAGAAAAACLAMTIPRSRGRSRARCCCAHPGRTPRLAADRARAAAAAGAWCGCSSPT
jgi:hypothetical protein